MRNNKPEFGNKLNKLKAQFQPFRMNKYEWWKHIKQKSPAFLSAIGVIVFGHWLALASLGDPIFEKWLPENYFTVPIFNIVVSLILLATSLIIVYVYRKAFLSARSFHYHPCQPHPCLIILLSPPDIKPPKSPLPWTLAKIDEKKEISVERTLHGISLSAEIEPLNELKWNWQQILRGLVRHSISLKEVRLIGSPDKITRDQKTSEEKITEGSMAFAEDAKRLIKTYFPDVEVHIQPQAVDFENFDGMVNIIKKTIKELRNKKYSDDDIIIDITGGQKTASIAAAAVTLNSRMHFQYVRAVPYGQVKPEEDVMSYDVRVSNPLIGEG